MSDMPERIAVGEIAKGVLYALPLEMKDDGDTEYIRADTSLKEQERLVAEVERLQEILRRAPCSQNSIPCRWPCGNDPSEHGPCWKQEALAQRAGKENGGDG